MSMNFDNLVEDAEKHGFLLINADKEYVCNMDELKALITQYVNQALAQGQEPVGYIGDGYFSPSKEKLLREGWLEEEIQAVYTHAQPTPAQIEDARLKGFNDAWERMNKKLQYVHMCYGNIPWQPYEQWINSIDKAIKVLGEPL